jgi:hypothetical protein
MKEDPSAHRLALNGLAENYVREISNSSAIAHPSDCEAAADGERHFVIAFEDSTPECIAADCVLAGVFGSGDVVARETFMFCQW